VELINNILLVMTLSLVVDLTLCPKEFKVYLGDHIFIVQTIVEEVRH
jgi:hypothetical protein